jgi:hypothetical protein
VCSLVKRRIVGINGDPIQKLLKQKREKRLGAWLKPSNPSTTKKERNKGRKEGREGGREGRRVGGKLEA